MIAWGAFYFRVTSRDRFKLVDDSDLKYVHPPRKDSIGACSAPYGPARVEVYDLQGAAGVERADGHLESLLGERPRAGHRVRLQGVRQGDEWAEGERWDWSAGRSGSLVQARRPLRQPLPHPSRSIGAGGDAYLCGDWRLRCRHEESVRVTPPAAGGGCPAPCRRSRRHPARADDRRQHLRRHTLLGIPIGATGDEDDDWFFTYFQPYRYVINRIAVYPSIGNHDSSETEECDDRAQVEDNFYIRERITGEEAAGRASFGPGLFYVVRYGSDIEFICIDTSRRHFFRGQRLFEFPKHWEFVEQSFPAADGSRRWRIPFAHHPPFSAGPRHHNTREMARLIPLFKRAGVKAMFSGHEHNFQHSRVDGIDYFVTGAAGKFRGGAPDGTAAAGTRSWSPECHFLLARIEGDRMTVRPMSERTGEEIARFGPDGERVGEPIVVRL